MIKKKNLTRVLGLGLAAGLVLTGCSSAGGDGDGDSNGGDEGESKEISIAVFNGWDEGIAASELWKAILEEQGYEVELEYADPAAVYLGLTEDDYDVTLDTWLPITHATYMEKYGDKLTDLGAWNDEAALTFAVNEDAPIDSIAELAENADLFNNEIIGIEPGAGLTETTEEAVIPTYGLEDMDYTISSTPAMLAELQSATDNGENIVVTLWRPHWAYDAFPIKDLEDPEGALGDAEGIHAVGSNNFETNFPEVNEWLTNFEMSSDLLYSLENVMFNEYDGDDYGPIVEQWISDNQEYVDGLTAGSGE
ncbi:MAG: glycine betaine ABC transporter substrate-binding protein [Agrococcus casei]|uniref:L-proline glycine betaine ABC transport system permease protein ProW (TC 3.A.1.12.1) n=1 Tax=Agrococcus casei LMG 22410 TaxID=1255656 RepID=A0A1R4F5B7_9MICO|nr:glycine betaine ABC transporter substrate-binding protein [Agrococcus casei]SJM51076.1 L-proline glycine betaine ABC transport system permease protein ProW (TC 3.A.1.12.1) [Agrococcus casei LMG 22410]